MPAPRPIQPILQPAAQDHAATYLETDEEVLAALRAGLGRPPAAASGDAPRPARVLARSPSGALATLVASSGSATLEQWQQAVPVSRPPEPRTRKWEVRGHPSGYAGGFLPVPGHLPTALGRVPRAGRAHRFGGGCCHGGRGRGPPHTILLPGLSGEHQPFGHADVHGILPHHGNGVFGEGGSGRGPCARRQTSGHRRRLRRQPAGLGKEIIGRPGRGAARP